jgi:hypothetical protein
MNWNIWILKEATSNYIKLKGSLLPSSVPTLNLKNYHKSQNPKAENMLRTPMPGTLILGCPIRPR